MDIEQLTTRFSKLVDSFCRRPTYLRLHELNNVSSSAYMAMWNSYVWDEEVNRGDAIRFIDSSDRLRYEINQMKHFKNKSSVKLGSTTNKKILGRICTRRRNVVEILFGFSSDYISAGITEDIRKKVYV